MPNFFWRTYRMIELALCAVEPKTDVLILHGKNFVESNRQIERVIVVPFGRCLSFQNRLELLGHRNSCFGDCRRGFHCLASGNLKTPHTRSRSAARSCRLIAWIAAILSIEPPVKASFLNSSSWMMLPPSRYISIGSILA